MAQKWPSTEQEFLHRFPLHESVILHDLPPELKSGSGSSWSAKHLQACRVLVKDHGRGIPILNDYMITARDRVAADRSLLKSLEEFSHEELRSFSHRALRSVTDFGSFFVSLADVARVRGQDVPRRHLRENVLRPSRPEFRSGEGEGLSSSPQRAPSPSPKRVSSPLTTDSSEYSPRNLDEEPDFEEQMDRKKHEIVCANMAAEFISVVVDLYSPRPGKNMAIEFSNAPNTFRLDSPQLNCICQDDGGIWLRMFNPGTRTWINTEGKLLCSLEAKPAYFQADSSGPGAISDRTLAQQFCELLGSVMAEPKDGDDKELGYDQRW